MYELNTNRVTLVSMDTVSVLDFSARTNNYNPFGLMQLIIVSILLVQRFPTLFIHGPCIANTKDYVDTRLGTTVSGTTFLLT